MRLNKILGTENIPILAQEHLHKVLLFKMIISFLMNLSSTFFILYVIDKIGFTMAATTTSIMLFTQLLFDYPSGALGDWIGQRWVLAIAYSSYCLFFLFLMQDPSLFEHFAIIGILNGVGNAQSSGAIETWVDNNYRKAVADSDPDRRIYGFAMSRVESFNEISLGASFLYGGILATQNTRVFVFAIQFFLTLIVILLIILFVTDIKFEGFNSTNTKEKFNLREYGTLLIGGLKFSISSKVTFFFLLGLSIYNVSWLIWMNLILFPIYFGYTGTDALASTLRTVVFFTGIPISYYMANVTKKISNEHFPLAIMLQVVFFFPIFIALTFFIPISNQINLLGVILTFLLLGPVVGVLFSITETLSQRILLDLIPSKNRNAVYSLLPSIVSLIGIPILPLAGAAVEAYGLSVGIALTLIVCTFGFIFIKLGMTRQKDQLLLEYKISKN